MHKFIDLEKQEIIFFHKNKLNLHLNIYLLLLINYIIYKNNDNYTS